MKHKELNEINSFLNKQNSKFSIFEWLVLIVPIVLILLGFLMQKKSIIEIACLSISSIFVIPYFTIKLIWLKFRMAFSVLPGSLFLFSFYLMTNKILDIDYVLFQLPFLTFILELAILFLFKRINNQFPIPTWRGDKLGQVYPEYKRRIEMSDIAWSIINYLTPGITALIYLQYF